jgi:2-C-methyl-D-erythritol 2,4-cyclodiphosphate synthase
MTIDHPQHLIGHSDADVLLHAVTDALLGGANLGDIGEWFPDSSAENRGRDSREMLRDAAARVKAAGWVIVNLDCIVFAEAPKLSPHKAAMSQSIASVLELPADCVSVKAKTGEGVDAVGQRLAISAQCVVLLAKQRT